MNHHNRQHFTIPKLGLMLGLILPASLAAQTDEADAEGEIIELTPFDVSVD